MKCVQLISLLMLTILHSFMLNIAEISLLINMKMPTIVGIFIFISREMFMLSCVEHEKRELYLAINPTKVLSIHLCSVP